MSDQQNTGDQQGRDSAGRFTPGASGNPNGRPKGSKNKASADVRTAVADIVEGNIDRVQDWLNQLSDKDPEKAANLLVKLMEFTTPKLARSEVSGSLETTTRLVIND